MSINADIILSMNEAEISAKLDDMYRKGEMVEENSRSADASATQVQVKLSNLDLQDDQLDRELDEIGFRVKAERQNLMALDSSRERARQQVEEFKTAWESILVATALQMEWLSGKQEEIKEKQKDLEIKALQSAQRMEALAQQIWGMVTNMLEAFGGVMDPMLKSMINIGFTVVGQFLSLKAAYATAASVSPWMWAHVAVMSASIGMSIYSAIKTQNEALRIKAEQDKAKKAADAARPALRITAVRL